MKHLDLHVLFTIYVFSFFFHFQIDHVNGQSWKTIISMKSDASYIIEYLYVNVSLTSGYRLTWVFF